MLKDIINSVSPRLFATVLMVVGAALILSSVIAAKKIKQISISEIWIYPIKSCKGIKLKSSIVVKTGFKYDRQFMLIDERRAFVSQRKYGNFCRMALIEQKINENEGMNYKIHSFNLFDWCNYRRIGSQCSWNACSENTIKWFRNGHQNSSNSLGLRMRMCSSPHSRTQQVVQ
jgi:hypothetical protein